MSHHVGEAWAGQGRGCSGPGCRMRVIMLGRPGVVSAGAVADQDESSC